MAVKLKTEVVISADRETVWRFFDNPDNMSKWQPNLKSFTHKSGDAGQPGAVSELVYEENGREITMIETVSERREPDFMAGSYESDWGKSVIVNQFEATEDGSTRWIGYWNHTFKGIFKVLGLFARKSMTERVQADMERFKLFVESSQ